MRRSAEQRRREIIETVLRLSTEVGPDRLSMRAVADAIGLTQPAIFRHFATREILWVEVARHVAGRMRTAWETVLAAAPPPDRAVLDLVAAQTREVAREPSILAIAFSHELRVANAELAAVFRGLMADFSARLAASWAGFGTRLTLSPQDAALLTLALVQGLALRWSLSGRRFDLTAEARRLLDIQMAGLLRGETGSTS
ncbi:MAG: TetR/AcrR family transcriptional regulator [Siculibacillus sp.]|nr:TetR/AcrR family transcriptional regulator [Siculibacillus sp.]